MYVACAPVKVCHLLPIRKTIRRMVKDSSMWYLNSFCPLDTEKCIARPQHPRDSLSLLVHCTYIATITSQVSVSYFRTRIVEAFQAYQGWLAQRQFWWKIMLISLKLCLSEWCLFMSTRSLPIDWLLDRLSLSPYTLLPLLTGKQ